MKFFCKLSIGAGMLATLAITFGSNADVEPSTICCITHNGEEHCQISCAPGNTCCNIPVYDVSPGSPLIGFIDTCCPDGWECVVIQLQLGGPPWSVSCEPS